MREPIDKEWHLTSLHWHAQVMHSICPKGETRWCCWEAEEAPYKVFTGVYLYCVDCGTIMPEETFRNAWCMLSMMDFRKER